MPPIGANAQLLSDDVLAKWLLEDFPFRIQLSKVFPFVPVGHALRYSSTGPLTPGVIIGHGDPIPEDTKLPKDPNRVYPIAEIATHFRVHYKAQDVFSNVNDQFAVQLANAVREDLYRFWKTFENGDASANQHEFDGLHRIVDPANVIDLQGRALSLEDLARAKGRVRSNDGRCVVMCTCDYGRQAVLAAHNVRGVQAHYQMMEFPSPAGGFKQEQVLTYDGAPLFINDLNEAYGWNGHELGDVIPPESLQDHDPCETAMNIWFFVLGPGNLHGIMPAKARSIIVRSTILADASTLVGHATMAAGIALGSLGALACLKNVSIPRG